MTIEEVAPKARVISFYLPQFHPIPENDKWWGVGFTEWRNVAQAKPLFLGHRQPHFPSDLGYYDLRVPEVRQQQAELAAGAGIESFCYWHYWFAGHRLLDRPITEVLATGKPDFGFCLGWANESWSGVWHGLPQKILIEQTYPGRLDHERHFGTLAEAFFDKRYTTVDGKPILYILRPGNIPNLPNTLDLWRTMAVKAGLPGLYFVAENHCGPAALRDGFDGYVRMPNWREVAARRRLPWRLMQRFHGGPELGVKWSQAVALASRRPAIGKYDDLSAAISEFLQGTDKHLHPCVFPGWDNSPRSGRRATVLRGSTPEKFRGQVVSALRHVEHNRPQERLVFLKSWNEWAEGNYMEPDSRWGHSYLDALKQVL